MTCQSTRAFLSESRNIVSDLFGIRPAIYWADFGISLIVGYGCGAVYLNSSWHQPQTVVCFVVAVCALYRLGSFMHEIVHFRTREMHTFRIVWDILAGIPMLTPSFFYESHKDHHNAQHYGTDHDGEYLPLGNGTLKDVGLFFAQVFIQPILVILRFLLAPVTFVHPKLRRWVLERASSFVIDFRYRRPIPSGAPLRSWAMMDVACSLRAWAIFAFVIAGFTEWTRIPQLYFLATSILALNYLRTLAAHRFLSDGQKMSHEEQLLDSTNIEGGSLTEILFPLGMRYHALHHLFPKLPYHNLGIAHRRLTARLAADSPYRETVFPSWIAVIRQLQCSALPVRTNRHTTHVRPLA